MTAIVAFILTHWKAVLAGLGVAVFSLLLVLAKADATHWHKVADQNAALYQTEQMAHAVTRTSLNTCLTSIDDQNTAVQNLAKESAARIDAADSAKKAAEKAAATSEATAKALDASSSKVRAGAAACPPSDTFWSSRGDL